MSFLTFRDLESHLAFRRKNTENVTKLHEIIVTTKWNKYEKLRNRIIKPAKMKLCLPKNYKYKAYLQFTSYSMFQ